eukprot:2913425-Rhodomonas_salina.1
MCIRDSTPSLEVPISLRACDAMSGTEIPYAMPAAAQGAESLGQPPPLSTCASATRCPVLTCRMVLPAGFLYRQPTTPSQGGAGG